MNRTVVDLPYALHCSRRSFSAVNLTLNDLKTAVFNLPSRTSQNAIVRSFSTTTTIKTGSKQVQQDLSTSLLRPFGSSQPLSKRKQFKQITPDKHIVNYLDTHQLGYCAKRKVPHIILIRYLSTILICFRDTVSTSGTSSIGKKVSIIVVHHPTSCIRQ